MKIKKGDQVQIVTGKDRGKRGNVVRVFPKEERIIVEGANLVKRHRRAKNENEKGERVEMAAPIHISNVMLVDPKSGKPSRVGFTKNGTEKSRVAKKSGESLK